MATIGSEEDNISWYLDTRCSNHMNGNKNWLIDLNPCLRNNVKFAYYSCTVAEGVGKVMIIRKDGKVAYRNDVLYVPSMKNNLLSLGQLLKKGYTMNMQQKLIEIYDSHQRLVIRAPLSKNRTIKVNLDTTEIQCLVAANVEDESWLWHYIYGHLNFKSLNQLSSKQMVEGLPQIQLPAKKSQTSTGSGAL